ncbi:RagB/SusD family nutrient uptake outer membrane protein [Mucilaginibacter sp. X5P1]|uniref:RagB/SusD family nutrient uptake outer membrane protein n=1 Tax=Mucilaginibacter sp. X5P1 TaxID=2723088 RepID=UPI00160800C5|nr:RagB/SusD family nutrient uptake outer membrane protein [Mucilaginibacter sp. X5P1]MBB6137241.1 hypothetical protein [Mucilaginibacter sp. X5P1]
MKRNILITTIFNRLGYRFATLGLILAILGTGCKKQLNVEPQDEITDVVFWKTASDFKSAANTLYQGLDRFGFDDTESDIAFNNPNTTSNGTLTVSQNGTNNIGGQPQWSMSYQYIRDANNIMAHGAGLTDAGIKQYVAEAQFFRAWYYWKIMEIYGGVPLISTVLAVNDPLLYTPRSTQKQTADFIISDLNAAAANLPLQSDLSAPDIGRITKGAALSLLARVALYEGTWEKYRGQSDGNSYFTQAIAATKTVMNSGLYALYTGSGAQSYRYNFIEAGDDSKECILDRRYARGIIGQEYPYDCDGQGYNPTKKLADMYLDTAGVSITSPGTKFQGYATMTSEYQFRDPRMTMTMIIPGKKTVRVFHPVIPIANYPDNPQRSPSTGYILYKYMSEDPIANNSGEMGDASLFDFDRHLIRYAEVLLIYAEATFESTGTLSDGDLNLSINVLRDRVGMPHLTNAFLALHGMDMKTEIRRERTVELALEGFRYDDVRRWKTAEVEMPENVMGIKIKGSTWQTYPLYSTAIYQAKADANGFMTTESGRTFDPAKDYLQPLPTQEVNLYQVAGHTLQQNPGW